MSDDLTTLLHESAQRVPTALHPAADLRRNAQHHQRVRRTGAGALALFLLAGAIGLSTTFGEGEDKAVQLPANQPISEKSLLGPDEVNAWGPFTYEEAATMNGEEANPPRSCLEGTTPMQGLGANEAKIWTRSFTSTASVEVRQVAAEFPTAEAANRAYTTIGNWFERCGKPEQGWPLVEAAGGEAQTVYGGSLGLTTDDPDSSEYAFSSYGVVGKSVTVVTLALIGQDANFMVDPLATTMRFALQRLAGSRTLTGNAVPETFRVAEERADDEWRGPDVERMRALTAEWQSFPCQEADLRGARPSDGQRTGMLSVHLNGSERILVRQVALYADEPTARAVADELRAEYAKCHVLRDTTGETFWTTERASELPDVTVHWSHFAPLEGEGSGEGLTAYALAIATQGNAVFVGDANATDEDGPNSAAVRAAAEAAKANLRAACEIADCS